MAHQSPTPTDAGLFLLTFLACVGLAIAICLVDWLSIYQRYALGMVGFVCMRVNLALARKMEAAWKGRI